MVRVASQIEDEKIGMEKIDNIYKKQPPDT